MTDTQKGVIIRAATVLEWGCRQTFGVIQAVFGSSTVGNGTYRSQPIGYIWYDRDGQPHARVHLHSLDEVPPPPPGPRDDPRPIGYLYRDRQGHYHPRLHIYAVEDIPRLLSQVGSVA